jgi:hypothetical protein
MRQERIGQLPEIRLERTRYAGDIVKGLDVGQVKGVVVAALKQLLDLLGLGRAASFTVDTFILHA